MKVRLFVFILLLLRLNLSAQTLTVREVYDIHPGDELGLRISRGYLELKWLKLIDRKEIGNDSLELAWYVRSLEIRFSGNTFHDDTLFLSVGDLDSPFFKNYDLLDTIVFDTVQGHVISVWEFRDNSNTGLCGVAVNSRYSSYSGEAYMEQKETLAYKGLGVLRKNFYYEGGPGDGDRYYEELEYFVKDGDTCGNKKDFPLRIHAAMKAGHAVLFPNPASHYLYIDGINEFSYTIFSLQGTELCSGSAGATVPIDIRDLIPGLYFLMLQDSNGVICWELFLKN